MLAVSLAVSGCSIFKGDDKPTIVYEERPVELSGQRERFDQTRDNAGSVAFGLRSTANIITGACTNVIRGEGRR